VLGYLDAGETSLVCKYWCQVTAYVAERRENPELTDDDFEILFDYEASRGGGGRGGGDKHSSTARQSDDGPQDGSSSSESQSQSQSDPPGSISTAPGGRKPH
jgi:hypothetical protein